MVLPSTADNHSTNGTVLISGKPLARLTLLLPRTVSFSLRVHPFTLASRRVQPIRLSEVMGQSHWLAIQRATGGVVFDRTSNSRQHVAIESARAATATGTQNRIARWSSSLPHEPKGPRLERVARRADEIYVARGGQNGKDMDDWLKAERDIDSEIEADI